MASKRYRFNIVVGDYCDEGHSLSTTYTLTSSIPFEEFSAAYKKACKKKSLQHLLPHEDNPLSLFHRGMGNGFSAVHLASLVGLAYTRDEYEEDRPLFYARYFVAFVNRYVSKDARLRILSQKSLKCVNEFVPGKTIGYESFSV